MKKYIFILTSVMLILAACGTPQSGSIKVSEFDNMPMVYIPAGEFTMGSADSDPAAADDEKPQHKVFLNAYWIDQTEVTNGMYKPLC